MGTGWCGLGWRRLWLRVGFRVRGAAGRFCLVRSGIWTTRMIGAGIWGRLMRFVMGGLVLRWRIVVCGSRG